MTVLANEQVIDGHGWRSGAPVEQRDLTQWFFKITSMAQELLDSLDTLDRWPEKVRVMQQNWIGRSEGLLIRWPIAPGTAPAGESELEVYTTRPDTIFGASFMAIAADHPLARKRGRRTTRRSRNSSTRSIIWAPRWRRSRPPRRRASTPASGSSIRSTRTGRCRSMSPISC